MTGPRRRRPEAESDFDRSPHSRGRGRAGEDEAARFLLAGGYRVVARNVVTPAGEIDVVAWDGSVLCFVEVKARASRRYGPAIGFVPAVKQKRLARSAALYVAREHLEGCPMRFDVLGLERAGAGWRYQLVQDAFRVTGSFLV